MKTNSISILPRRAILGVIQRGRTYGIFAAMAVLIGLNGDIATGQERSGGRDAQREEVLTRGPVHEAFAGVVIFNPEPGVVVENAPPRIIEELPPEERPEGDNVTWIPGYWAWDDERSDYLWISGTWRALPPGREWIGGYWATVPQGHQWTSGYWADSTVEETTYLPKPPATVERGPNIAAPSPDHGWTPGNWMWHDERYAWRPGYWAEGRTNWEWIPAHYVWTPRGYIFVDGYWDHGIARRGVLFAPVYFGSGAYSQPGYRYSPSVAINLLAFVENIFLRPRYHHYYFGDYYEPRYRKSGFYSPFAFQSDRYGYDPVYSHQRWQHRKDRDWERNYETSYQYRRDHESARPPRTWAAQRGLNGYEAGSSERGRPMATSFDKMTKSKDSSLRFQSVPSNERQKLAQRGHEIQKSREGRQALEARSDETTGGKPGQEIKATRAKLPKSSIVGEPSSKLEKNQGPPKPQRAPGPTATNQPKAQGTDRQAKEPKGKSPQEPRQADSKKEPRPMPGRDEAAPSGKAKQPEPGRQEKEPKGKTRQEPRQPDAKKEQTKSERTQAPSRTKSEQPAPERQAVKPQAKPQQEPQRQPSKSERKAQPEPQRQPSQPRTRETQKPGQEVEKSHGKGNSTPGEDDEKSNANSSKKKSR